MNTTYINVWNALNGITLKSCGIEAKFKDYEM